MEGTMGVVFIHDPSFDIDCESAAYATASVVMLQLDLSDSSLRCGPTFASIVRYNLPPARVAPCGFCCMACYFRRRCSFYFLSKFSLRLPQNK